MIDIHTHILPGVDDGAANWEDTLALARAAQAEGITRLVATPHHANGRYLNEARQVVELTQAVNERLAREGIGLTVLAGQEIRVHDDLLAAWTRGDLLTLGGTNVLLIELPSGRIPPGTADLIHELTVLGLRPVIAHPERNSEVAAHPDRYAELLAAGAYGQVTSHSLLGGFGKRIEQVAWSLCRSGGVQLVASDAHHAQQRGFRLAEAYARIGRQLGEAWADYYRGNAERLLAGEVPGSPPQETVVRRLGIRGIISSLFHK